jgi:2-polyprenyl-3-methyl-5-hydroxy-6-metoxy-1,4-benzoquinol methylase
MNMTTTDTLTFRRFEENRSLDEAMRMFRQRLDDARAIYMTYHDSFVARPCPVCGALAGEDADRFHEMYRIQRCARCACMFVNPAPSLDALKDYYNNAECNRMMDAVYRARAGSGDFINDHRVMTVIRYLGAMPHAATMRILEIGCGSGSFLSKLRCGIEASGPPGTYEYTGIDIDGNAVARNQDVGVSLSHASAEEFAVVGAAGTYDLLLHFELIEHLVDPFGFMQAARRLLKPGGLMLFTTPNADALEMTATGYNGSRLLAHSIFPPMHLNAFSTSNITAFALRSGFAIDDIETPGALDVDMIGLTAAASGDPHLQRFATLSDDAKALVQHLLVRSKASSHMRCVLRRVE